MLSHRGGNDPLLLLEDHRHGVEEAQNGFSIGNTAVVTS